MFVPLPHFLYLPLSDSLLVLVCMSLFLSVSVVSCRVCVCVCVLDDYEISFTIKQVKLGVVNILPVNTLLVFVCLKTAHEVREGKKL